MKKRILNVFLIIVIIFGITRNICVLAENNVESQFDQEILEHDRLMEHHVQESLDMDCMMQEEQGQTEIEENVSTQSIEISAHIGWVDLWKRTNEQVGIEIEFEYEASTIERCFIDLF